MKYVLFILAFLPASVAFAQKYPQSEMNAVYLATLKAVLDYKMNDEENSDKLQKLREDEKFNENLRKKLSKLNNNKLKTGSNKRIYEMLIKSGKQIYDEIN